MTAEVEQGSYRAWEAVPEFPGDRIYLWV